MSGFEIAGLVVLGIIVIFFLARVGLIGLIFDILGAFLGGGGSGGGSSGFGGGSSGGGGSSSGWDD